jgi:hypothetical protein
VDYLIVAQWSFLTNHARGSVTLCDQRADLTSRMPGFLDWRTWVLWFRRSGAEPPGGGGDARARWAAACGIEVR